MLQAQREATVEGIGEPGSLAQGEVLPWPEDHRQTLEHLHVAGPFDAGVFQTGKGDRALRAPLNDGGEAESRITRACRRGSGAEEREAQPHPECGAAFLVQEGDELRRCVGTRFGSSQPDLLRRRTQGLDTAPQSQRLQQLTQPGEEGHRLEVGRMPAVGLGKELIGARDRHLEEVIVQRGADMFHLKFRRVGGVVGIVDDVQQVEDGVTERRGLRQEIRGEKIEEASREFLMDLCTLYVVAERRQSGGQGLRQVVNLPREGFDREREVGDAARHGQVVVPFGIGRAEDRVELREEIAEIECGQADVVEAGWKVPAQQFQERARFLDIALDDVEVRQQPPDPGGGVLD